MRRADPSAKKLPVAGYWSAYTSYGFLRRVRVSGAGFRDLGLELCQKYRNWSHSRAHERFMCTIKNC